METNIITGQIIDSSIKIHKDLGPGLLESVYEMVLAKELTERGFHVERQVPVNFSFNGMNFDDGFRIDLFVEREVVVELKSIERLAPVHFKQLQTYLRLVKVSVGLLINFGGATLMEGVRRVVNDYKPLPGSEFTARR
jgi:GxxExxY protein